MLVAESIDVQPTIDVGFYPDLRPIDAIDPAVISVDLEAAPVVHLEDIGHPESNGVLA